ncbi:MAG: hypothetical protein QF886_15070, partial [Planctomycetota bacterium]|nr:hypothetical protein [Planctomycetota bacterium]
FDQQAPLLRLFIKETTKPKRRYLSKAKVSPKIAKAIADKWDSDSGADGKIFWIYKDEEIDYLIDDIIEGDEEHHVALGYPDCCANAYWEDRTVAVEKYYQAIKKQHRAKSDAKILKLVHKGVPVKAALPGAERAIQTVSKFPFLPYIACRDCLKWDSSSAAGEQNERFQRVLQVLDENSARKVLLMAQMMAEKGTRKS